MSPEKIYQQQTEPFHGIRTKPRILRFFENRARFLKTAPYTNEVTDNISCHFAFFACQPTANEETYCAVAIEQLTHLIEGRQTGVFTN